MDTPYKESNPSRMHVTCKSLFSSIILALSLAIPSKDANIASFTLAGLWPCSRASSISLHQSQYEMASSFVVSRNNGKLRGLFLGLRNSFCAQVCSLCMARFLWHSLLAEGARSGHPEASVSSPVLASSLVSKTLVASPSSSLASSQAESNCSHSGLSSWTPNKVGRCAKVGSSKFISLSCCCTMNRSAHLVMPRPRGDHCGMAGWAFMTGAITKAFK